MKLKLKISVFIFSIIISFLFLSHGFVWAANPVAEKESPKPEGVAKPPEPEKKVEKIIIKGREYCLECIDNSECLGCHTKISERKLPSPFMEPIPAIVATGTLQTLKPMGRQKGKNSYRTRYLSSMS